VVYIRRFEYYTNLIEQVDWSKVGAVIMVNDFLADGFKKRTGVKPHVVYNSVDPDEWTFKEREPGSNIAWVGFVNQKKNLPLALQIMHELPRDYVLHVAGDFQDAQSMDYAVHMANLMGIKVNFYGQIRAEHMDAWLEDKSYLLNTSISEGCPNSVLEAMAKGIKPVVHNWPGAEQQFRPFYPFYNIRIAVGDIRRGDYDSNEYRSDVIKTFGSSNYTKVRQIIQEVANGT
jgi:glycosyltransferase involved in cell wall biosynthesis